MSPNDPQLAGTNSCVIHDIPSLSLPRLQNHTTFRPAAESSARAKQPAAYISLKKILDAQAPLDVLRRAAGTAQKQNGTHQGTVLSSRHTASGQGGDASQKHIANSDSSARRPRHHEEDGRGVIACSNREQRHAQTPRCANRQLDKVRRRGWRNEGRVLRRQESALNRATAASKRPAFISKSAFIATTPALQRHKQTTSAVRAP